VGVEESRSSFQQVQPVENEAAMRDVILPRPAPDVPFARDSPAEVLVVEDDEDELRILHRVLRRHGMESRFKIVGSGEDALAYLRAATTHDERKHSRPKVVILDLKLPGIGGREVLREIRADARMSTLAVVILSSSRSERDVCECYRLGANSFVPKPLARDHPGDHLLDIAKYWVEINRPVPGS
jgi:two-component system, response regulator